MISPRIIKKCFSILWQLVSQQDMPSFPNKHTAVVTELFNTILSKILENFVFKNALIYN